MDARKNARLTVDSRQVLARRVIEQGLRLIDAAQAMAVSPRTVHELAGALSTRRLAGLSDRSCRTNRCPHRL
ncbi:leucine zipper domain-containing protein [Salinisphaera sp.]|uniref:leucine zipper domain-containing protein n=1 Tax=Salinisphaera sp. TaxID=1914330 RepID=UPI003C7D67EB